MSEYLWKLIFQGVCFYGIYAGLIGARAGARLWWARGNLAVRAPSLHSAALYWAAHTESTDDSIGKFNRDLSRSISGLIDDISAEQKRTVADVQRATNTTIHTPRYHHTDLLQLFNVRYLPDTEYSRYVAAMQARYGDDAWLSQEWLNNGARLLPDGSSDMMDALLAFTPLSC